MTRRAVTSTRILREFIRESIAGDMSRKVGEKLQKAQEGNLGLFIRKGTNSISVTLYDAGKLVELCQGPIEDDDGLYHFSEVAPGTVVAYLEMLRTEGCGGAMQVTTSMAKGGLGPLIYDLAMAASPDGIVSDRQAVSDKAYNMYKKMFDSRLDVTKTELSGECRTWNNPKDDFLNYSYSGGSRIDAGQLMATHDSMMEKLSGILGLSVKDLEGQIGAAGWKAGDKEVKKASEGTMHYHYE